MTPADEGGGEALKVDALASHEGAASFNPMRRDRVKTRSRRFLARQLVIPNRQRPRT